MTTANRAHMRQARAILAHFQISGRPKAGDAAKMAAFQRSPVR